MTTFNIKQEKEKISAAASLQQKDAANPNYSVWVEASAGTGKTKVLSDRVLRLLINNVNPSKILCLTYTNAAAVEMKSRISKKLGEWAVISEEKLKEELYKLMGDDFSDSHIENARILFAKVLDEPGGIKIQTIHSFCQEILSRFPLEANIAPYFSIMDDRMAREALANIGKKLILKAKDEPQSDIGQAVSWLTGNVKENKFGNFMREIIKERNKLSRILSQYESFQSFLECLHNKLGIKEGETAETIIAEFENTLDKDLLKTIADAWAKSSPTDVKNAQTLYSLLENFNYETYKKTICSKKSCYDGAVKAFADIKECVEQLRQDIEKNEDRIIKVDLCKSTAALMGIAEALNEGYWAYKKLNSRLDYEDLIVVTRNLLEKEDVAKWVLYKLDGGISHVLIDEAQDTSPNQWAVIKAFTGEFFDGKGQEEGERTIFAVGDRKQSIYRFQGADPQEFDNMYRYFQKKSSKFKSVCLEVSFRSTKAVLDIVNSLFTLENAKSGVVIEGEPVRHKPYRIGEAGHVELWPLIEKTGKDEDDIWQPPVERIIMPSVSTQLAAKIASKIKDMVENKVILESQNRPVCYKDFMVLVKTRRNFMETFVKECKKIGVNVTGVDRLKVLNQIAVEDMLSLAKFLLLPTDDLSLAEVLKSPIFGLSEEDLFDLCYDRKGSSLWQRLKESTKHEDVVETLKNLIKTADYIRPFELFNYVLTVLQGRKKFVARQGLEAEDAIDEFMNLTLSFEQEHIPNLQMFMRWICADDVEIKRELEQAQEDAVRIMTVHASKGLQAPIVILPDTISLVSTSRGDNILFDENFAYFPLSAKKYDSVCNKIHDNIVEQEFNEYRRLLYVALTRAEDMLYICGFKRNEKVNPKSWYALCDETLKTNGNTQDDKIFTYSCKQEAEVETKDKKDEKTEINFPIPDWLHEKVKEESPLARPYTPSKPDDEDVFPVSSPLKDNGFYFQRGLLIHSVLQFLPTDASFSEQLKFIDTYLSKNAKGLSEKSVSEIKEELADLLKMPQCATIFGSQSRAEVPIMGEVDGRIISAQIDRLIVTDDKIIIVDFKTNRPAAENIESVKPTYLKQLKVYKQLLEKIYPNKAVEGYILWTNTANLMRII